MHTDGEGGHGDVEPHVEHGALPDGAHLPRHRVVVGVAPRRRVPQLARLGRGVAAVVVAADELEVAHRLYLGLVHAGPGHAGVARHGGGRGAAVLLARARVAAVRLDQLAHQRDAELHAVLAGPGPDGRQLLSVRQQEERVLPRQRVLGLALVVRQDLALVAADLARLLMSQMGKVERQMEGSANSAQCSDICWLAVMALNTPCSLVSM